MLGGEEEDTYCISFSKNSEITQELRSGEDATTCSSARLQGCVVLPYLTINADQTEQISRKEGRIQASLEVFADGYMTNYGVK
jgi:hypothetical protein